MTNETMFRYRVVTSDATLPVVVVGLVVSWLSDVPFSLLQCVMVAAAVVVAIGIALWSDACMLLRVRSRMVSAWFVAFVAACPFLAQWGSALIPAVCALGFYAFLFHAYQRPRPAAYVFHAFAFLGLGSFFFPQWLFFVPVLWGAMSLRLRVYGLRVWAASLLGIALPYWVYGIYAVWRGRLDTAFGFLGELFSFSPPDYASLPLPVVVSFVFLTFCVVLFVLHFNRTSYNDKIRVRMYYRLLTTQAVLQAAFLVAQPHLYETLFPLYILTSSPLVGHYLAFARGRGMNAWFVCLLLLLLSLALYNHLAPWMPLSAFL